MLVIGLLLILAGAVLTVFALLGGGQPASLSWHAITVDTTALGIFATGALALLTLEVGILATRRGTARGLSRRRELTRLRRAAAVNDSSTGAAAAGSAAADGAAADGAVAGDAVAREPDDSAPTAAD